MKKLNELDDGSCGTIVAITGDSHFQSRITSIGLTIGSRIAQKSACPRQKSIKFIKVL